MLLKNKTWWGVSQSLLLASLGLIFSLTQTSAENLAGTKPNIIIVFTDDQGYQDLGCYGSPDIKTPHLDKMAAEGMKFTSFYAQTVCGPSRAALMTGCYPYRISRTDNGVPPHPEVALSEIFLPEILKPLGYKTGMVGKWDMAGHNPNEFLMALRPEAQGFDFSFWTPGSNDKYVDLYQGAEKLESKAKMATLTQRYTDHAIEFIEENKEDPFFLYVAHTMPHTKLAASKDFKGQSKGGLYGDVIEEIDHHVGRLLETLKKNGLDENTYVIFTSDNGPWWIRKDHGGHCEPLRGAKTSCYEGGFRVPCIIRAPGKVPAGQTSEQVLATIDLLPTFAKITGAKVPTDRTIDGIDASGIFHGTTNEIDRPFFYYQHRSLRAVRVGDWKLHLPHSAKDRQNEGKNWQKHVPKSDRPYLEELTLYKLKDDIGETKNVAKDHPEITEKLLKHLTFIKEDLGDSAGRGKNARPLNAPVKP